MSYLYKTMWCCTVSAITTTKNIYTNWMKFVNWTNAPAMHLLFVTIENCNTFQCSLKRGWFLCFLLEWNKAEKYQRRNVTGVVIKWKSTHTKKNIILFGHMPWHKLISNKNFDKTYQLIAIFHHCMLCTCSTNKPKN